MTKVIAYRAATLHRPLSAWHRRNIVRRWLEGHTPLMADYATPIFEYIPQHDAIGRSDIDELPEVHRMLWVLHWGYRVIRPFDIVTIDGFGTYLIDTFRLMDPQLCIVTHELVERGE